MNHFLFRNSWWSKRKRPRINIGVTLFDFIIEITGLVAVLAIWGSLAVTYSGLPDAIPIHYNMGQVDKPGGKNSIFILPALATVLFVGMKILCRFPHRFNYPVKITENNAFLQYRNMAKMIRCLTLAIILVFGYIFFHTVLNTGENTAGIVIWFLPVTLATIFIPITYFMVKSFMYR